MRRIGYAFLVSCAGVVAVALAEGSLVRSLVLVGALAGADAVLFRVAIARSRTPLAGSDRLITPVVVAWLVLNLGTPHRFASRGTHEAVSSLGRDQMLELVYFAGIGLVALSVIRQLQPDLRLVRPPLLLVLLPVWITTSAAWSPIAPYSLVRGLQTLVIAALAWATMVLVQSSSGVLEELLKRYLRWFVRVVVALTAAGVAFGPILPQTSGSNLDRFSWIGAHPNGAGLLLATAAIITMAAPRELLGMGRAGRAVVLLAFAAALYANQSRGALASLVAASGVVALLHLRRRPEHRRLVVPAAAAVLAAGLLGRSQISAYLLRGNDVETFADWNGRLGLWSEGFRLLETAFDWLCGLGYGVVRTVFLPGNPWAKSAHNSMLSMLVSVGIVGSVLLVVLVATGIRRGIRSGLFHDPYIGLPVVGVLAVTLTNGLVSDALAEPKTGLATLYLLIAVASVYRRNRPPPDLRYCPRSDGGDEASMVVPGVRRSFLPTGVPLPDRPEPPDRHR